MAGRKRSTGDVNRSEFIRKILEENENATADEVIEAWKATGSTEELSKTLYYQARRKLGLAKTRGGRKRRKVKAAKVATAAAARRTSAPMEAKNGSDSAYLSIEKQIDNLVNQADALGDGQLAAALRQARRHASSKLL